MPGISLPCGVGAGGGSSVGCGLPLLALRLGVTRVSPGQLVGAGSTVGERSVGGSCVQGSELGPAGWGKSQNWDPGALGLDALKFCCDA